MASPTQHLASLYLGRDAVAWAIERRADGEPSYRSIAGELRHLTEGTVDVTDETMRRWCTEKEVAG